MRRMLAILFTLSLLWACRLAFGARFVDDDDPDAAARARLVPLLARAYDDPSFFNAVILGQPPFWWRQDEIGDSVVNYRDTVVYSGNAIGKDYLVGRLVPWWLYTREDALVIVTGPGQSLLGSVTWKEIRRAVDRSRFPLGCKISEGIKASPLTVRVAAGWQALGFSTTSIERASGQHARKLLVIVEEASGLEDEQWEALSGLKYSRLLAIGNPIRARGKFVDMIRAAEKHRRDRVPPRLATNAIHVPSTDSPHADLEESPFGLADRTFLEAEMRRYGPDSLWVRSHIHAVIPAESSEVLIPESWLDWAASDAARPSVPYNHPRRGRRRIACDLGEGVGRDSSAILVRDSLQVLDFAGGSAMGLPEAAQAIADMRAKWQVPDDGISYDKLGIGKDFPQYLKRHGIVGALPYAGEMTPRSSEFTNLRTEAAWAARTRLNTDWAPDPARPALKQPPFWVPPSDHWPRLRDELSKLTYELAGRQTRLVPKKDLQALLGHSPDFADVFCQSFAF